MQGEGVLAVTENSLIELGTEEPLPKALRKLAEYFAENFTQELTKAELAFERVEWLAAPRRLASRYMPWPPPSRTNRSRNVVQRQRRLCRWQADTGCRGLYSPPMASRSTRPSVQTDKGEWLLYRATVAGQPTRNLIATMTATALAALPIPKLMRWGASRTQFVRPVHTLPVAGQ